MSDHWLTVYKACCHVNLYLFSLSTLEQFTWYGDLNISRNLVLASELKTRWECLNVYIWITPLNSYHLCPSWPSSTVTYKRVWTSWSEKMYCIQGHSWKKFAFFWQKLTDSSTLFLTVDVWTSGLCPWRHDWGAMAQCPPGTPLLLSKVLWYFNQLFTSCQINVSLIFFNRGSRWQRIQPRPPRCQQGTRPAVPLDQHRLLKHGHTRSWNPFNHGVYSLHWTHFAKLLIHARQ